MPRKITGTGQFQAIDRWDRGLGWFAHPSEGMERASHALVTDDGVYLVDPLDTIGLDEHLAELGEIAGIVVLLAEHTRHAARLATRHDVPVYVPEWLRVDLDVPVVRFTGQLGESDYALEPILVNRIWREGALWNGRTLYVPESVGTAEYFLAPDERLGVSHMRRFWPPEGLTDYDPERLIVGHGTGIFDDPAVAITTAVENSRPSAWTFYRRNGLTHVRTLASAIFREA